MEAPFSGLNGNNREPKIDRRPVVAGSFYPASKSQLNQDIKGYFDSADAILESQPLAVIVPHAGYVFSAGVAASAFKQINRNAKFKHVFLIGSSHTMYFNGASIYTRGDFITPLGTVKVDPLAKDLVDNYSFITDDVKPHEREHSLEVQLPLLQYWLKNEFSIIPIILGGDSQSTSTLLAEALAPYFNEENLFVISSDFSHYPSYANAKVSDDDMAQAIVSNSSVQFMKTKLRRENSGMNDLATTMCGWTSGLTLLKITEERKDVEYKTIQYRNSGDSPYGDKDRVVGYWAIAVVKKQPGNADFTLTDSDKKYLLNLARNTITRHLKGDPSEQLDEAKLSPNLLANAGAFVTLRKNGQLRGCIGNFSTTAPLYKVVMGMAIAAATEDYRFDNVSLRELDDIDVEISVLTPMKRIKLASEFIPGKHGIYIKKGCRSGTFLPQVGTETGWSREELLGHCARDKAFIGWDGWKDNDTELYTYEAIVFEEKELY
ncbi:MAG: AmmeMemoRadiSam system protein B [Bacteroidales bacterium]